MANRQFDAVEVEGVDSSFYDMSHEHKFTCNMGELVPTLMEEVLPADNWKIRTELFQRMAPFVAPVMHKIDNFVYGFYVPNRLIWRSFNDFIKNSADSTTFNDNKEYEAPIPPYFTITQLVDVFDDSHQFTNCDVINVDLGVDTHSVTLYTIPDSVIKLLENIGVPINLMSSIYLSSLGSAYSTWSADLKQIITSAIETYGYKLISAKFVVTSPSSTTKVHRNSYALSTLKISSLPLRAYFKIWFEWFRDKNLESVAFDFDKDGQEDDDQLLELLTLRYKCWEHDYFTSCLPDPQRGPDVALSLAGNSKADVTLKSESSNNGLIKKKGLNGWTNFPTENSGALTSFGGTFSSSEFEPLQENAQFYTEDGISSGIINEVGIGFNAGQSVAYDPNGTLEVQLDNNISFTINQLRYQSKLQQFYETFARVGNRIKEWLKAFFNVDLSDARAMLTEYCGGQRIPVQVSSVEQNSMSDEATSQPLGQLAGRAQSSGSSFIDVYCPEHGFIVVVQATIPRTSYSQMLRTKFTRRTYLDYCIPMFQSLGEQEVKEHELFFDCSNDTSNAKVFGYQARYQDYKYIPDQTCGDFLRSLNFYTLTRQFDSAPNLNVDFTKSQPSSRVFAVEDESTDKLWNDLYFDISLRRNLAYYSIPKLS